MGDEATKAGALLTIGAFARTSRLSIKALRLYDESGLLPPAWTDPESGYRYYGPGQLERARLVAWLRRVGMRLVQSMLDEGRITPQEAESHPQRTLLVQALGGSERSPEPELRVTDVRAGDRYLLCTDGLSRSVGEREIQDVLEGTGDPADAVRGLIELATDAGGADNVACVVALID